MPLFTIDAKTCNRDGLCADICPVGCISFTRGELPFPDHKKQDYCLACGHCVAVCPTNAIRLESLPGDRLERDRDLDVSFDQARQFLTMRRSVRAFKELDVDRNLLESLLQVAQYAPSGHNARPTRWVVAPSRERVAEIAGAIARWMRREAEQETTLATTLHLAGIVRVWDSGRDIICRNAPVLAVGLGPNRGITPHEDVAVAVSYLELAATGGGLGACWCGYLMTACAHSAEVRDVLGVGEGQAVYGALMLGHPARKFRAVPPRPAPIVTWL